MFFFFYKITKKADVREIVPRAQSANSEVMFNPTTVTRAVQWSNSLLRLRPSDCRHSQKSLACSYQQLTLNTAGHFLEK